MGTTIQGTQIAWRSPYFEDLLEATEELAKCFNGVMLKDQQQLYRNGTRNTWYHPQWGIGDGATVGIGRFRFNYICIYVLRDWGLGVAHLCVAGPVVPSSVDELYELLSAVENMRMRYSFKSAVETGQLLGTQEDWGEFWQARPLS